jgi:hypothetical protein
MDRIEPELRNARIAMCDAHKAGNVRLVEEILAAHPKLLTVEVHEGTWLHTAANSGSIPLVEFWLAKGFDVNLATPGYTAKDGLRTPLHSASNAEVTRFLISRGAKVNAWCRYGGTPLHVAVVTSNAEQTKVLLEAGADPSITDREGRTPLSMAIELKRTACEDVLRSSKAPMKGQAPPGQKMSEVPQIDLQKDSIVIVELISNAVLRFTAEHSQESVTAVALAASGIEGYVMLAFDSVTLQQPERRFSDPWDAVYSEYATAEFEDWSDGYEFEGEGGTIMKVQGTKVSLKAFHDDAAYENPFFDACVWALKQAQKRGIFNRLRRANDFQIGVEMALGGQALFWPLSEGGSVGGFFRRLWPSKS